MVCMPMSRRNRYYVTFMSGWAHSSVFKNLLFLLPPTACCLSSSFACAYARYSSTRAIKHFSSSFVSFSSKWKRSSCHGTYGNVSVCLKSALCANSNATLACTWMKIVIISPANQPPQLTPPHKIQFTTTHFVDISYCISIMLLSIFLFPLLCICCEIWDKTHILLHSAPKICTREILCVSLSLSKWLAFNFIAASVMLGKAQMTFWW